MNSKQKINNLMNYNIRRKLGMVVEDKGDKVDSLVSKTINKLIRQAAGYQDQEKPDEKDKENA